MKKNSGYCTSPARSTWDRPVGARLGEDPPFPKPFDSASGGYQCTETPVNLGIDAIHRIDDPAQIVASARGYGCREVPFADRMHQPPHQADRPGDRKRQHQQGEFENDQDGNAQRDADIGEDAGHGVANISPVYPDHCVPDLPAALNQGMRDVVVGADRNECAGIRGKGVRTDIDSLAGLRREQHLAFGVGHGEIGNLRVVGQQVFQIGVHPPQAFDRDIEAHRRVEIVGNRTGQDVRLVLDDRLQPRLDRAERNPGKERICGNESQHGDETDADADARKGRSPSAGAAVGVHRSFLSAAASVAAVSRTEAL